ncbi:MAG: tetratricopeptide repeat protein [Acidobacteriota bacterium]
MSCLQIWRGGILCVIAALAALPSWSQSAPSNPTDWDGHLAWVLPFENNSTQPGLDWIGASFPDILDARLSSAGFLTIRREDRRYAMQHLGLPADFHPTQATAYRIAQTLDADYVIFGNYTVANGRIRATARVLEMHGPNMGATLEQEGSLDQLINIEDELAWKVAMQINPNLNLEEQTFVAASRDLRLDAFENYIRGLVEPGVEERIGHLAKAVQLSPGYVQAWFALGLAYFDNQQYDQARAAFARVPKGGQLSLEAMFYSGLSNLYTGNYASAQASFASIASVLPLPEVLNNEGIAFNRRGQNGTAFFKRVVEMEPQSADYWFNLSVSERRQKNYTTALNAVAHCLSLNPQDEEAQNLRKNLMMLKSGQLTVVSATPAASTTDASTDQASSDAADDQPDSDEVAKDKPDTKNSQSAPSSTPPSTGSDATSPDYEPLERIARTYDESSLRQGAFALEQMSAMKLRSLPPSERAQRLSQQGRAYVNDGLLLEAERQFQLALAADPHSSTAYAGLAEVHEYAGSITIAQQEANKSLQYKPNAAAYLVLARIALSQHALSDARNNIDSALRLEPDNTAAKGILQAIQTQQDHTN